MEKKYKPLNSIEKALPVIAALVIIFGTLLIYRGKGKSREAVNLPYYSYSLDEVADGVYAGKTYTKFMHLQLEVTIVNHQIKKIDVIENEGSQGYKAAAIIERMIEQNKIAVPAIKEDQLGSIVFISCVNTALLEGLPVERKNQLVGEREESVQE